MAQEMRSVMGYLKMRAGRGVCAVVTAAVAFTLCMDGNAMSVGAAETVRVSGQEYNLTVEDLPDGVERAYAKFHDGTLDAGNYMLSLFDGYDAMIQMEEALTAAGEDISDIEYQAFEATVYEMDEDEDYYPLDGMQGITLICPLPEGFAENSGKVQITAVDANGALCRVDSKIVQANGQDCVMFDLSVFTTYAFLYKSSGALTSGKHPTPTPVLAKATPTPTPRPTQAAEKTPTPRPTQAAEKTPTPRPTQAAGKTPTPKLSQAAEKTPTKAPAKAGAASGGSSAAATAPQRDKTPQTGDSFTPDRYFAMLAAGGMLVGLGFFLGHKKK